MKIDLKQARYTGYTLAIRWTDTKMIMFVEDMGVFECGNN
jgi:hypothetical protein